MTFSNRVAVHNYIGRRLFTAHRELAMFMVRSGEADYENSKTIVLTQMVRTTAEMLRPRIRKHRVPVAESSSGDPGRGCPYIPRYQALHVRAGGTLACNPKTGAPVGRRIVA